MPLLPRLTPVSLPLGDGPDPAQWLHFRLSFLRPPEVSVPSGVTTATTSATDSCLAPCLSSPSYSSCLDRGSCWPPSLSAPSAAQLRNAVTKWSIVRDLEVLAPALALASAPASDDVCASVCGLAHCSLGGCLEAPPLRFCVFLCLSSLALQLLQRAHVSSHKPNTPLGPVITAQTLTHLLSIARLTSVTPHLSPLVTPPPSPHPWRYIRQTPLSPHPHHPSSGSFPLRLII